MKLLQKSQISIFVIVSVILVVIGIIFFTVNFDSVNIFTDQKSSYKVKEYVQSCLEVETKNAVELLGKHGGWIPEYSPNIIYTDRSKPDEYNRMAKGIDLFEKNKIPYWYYYDDANEIFKSNIPDYDGESEFSIRSQMRKYIEDNLENNCIQGFVVFADIYDIKYEPQDIKKSIEVKFNKNQIIVTLVLPLQIHEINTQNIESIDYFQTKFENKLWIPYNLARDITHAQMQSSFIEIRILNFLNPYQNSKSRDLLPPFYDFRVEYDFRPWDVRDVEKLTKQIISSNIGRIQFLNTDYDEPKVPQGLEDSDFVKGFNSIYIKDYLTEHSITKNEEPRTFREYENYKVKPTYEGSFFPTYFKLSPSLGNVILLPRPQSIINLIPFFFTEYVAVYEMTLPVIFEIRSNQPNDNFVFNLAIEANIDHNTPLSQNIGVEIGKDELEFDFENSLICDPVQFISSNIALNISDPVNHGKRKDDYDLKTGVEGATITFDCKGISSCLIGQTQINGNYYTNNITMLNFRLPINCNPGTLEIYKYGHTKLVFENLDPQIDKPINLGEAYMSSKKEMKIDVKLVPSNSIYSIGRALREHENGFLIFTNLEDEEIVEVVDINFKNQYDLDILLTNGNYSIQGFVMTNKSFIIPEETFCYSKGLFSGSDCQTIPEIEFDAWLIGGIEIENYHIELDYLLARDGLKIKLVDYGIPGSFDELETISKSMTDIKEISPVPLWD